MTSIKNFLSKAFTIFSISASLSVILSACSDPAFTIKGDIEGVDNGSVLLEKADHAGLWIAIDSTSISKSGSFSLKANAPAAPEIYRLAYNGHYIYFPIDSIETVTIKTTSDAFDTDFTLAGTDNAVTMMNLEKDIIRFAPNMANADSLTNFKRYIYTTYLNDARGSIVSYYALTKTVGDSPLFGDVSDAPYFAAVATAFDLYKHDDPRTEMLRNTAGQLRRRHNSERGKKHVVSAGEINLIDIDLPDTEGKDVALSDVVGGKPTLLIFTMLLDPETPAANAKIRTLYDAGGCNVYEVCFDTDRLQWRDAAKALPWSVVYAGSDDAAARVAASYQLDTLPQYFIIDAAGTIRKRCPDLATALSSL